MYAIGFGSIGMGMGMAIGAGVAAPDDPVAFVCGDGGFMTSGITEFNTAVRHNIDLITIVCNDGAYGAESGICAMPASTRSSAPSTGPNWQR